jgi:hypothetical protein
MAASASGFNLETSRERCGQAPGATTIQVVRGDSSSIHRTRGVRTVGEKPSIFAG